MFPALYLVHTVLVLSLNLNLCVAEDYTAKADAFINELVLKYDYKLEKHTVTTEDGYLLTVHHVVSKSAQTNTTRRVVLISNGLQVTTVDFFLMGPHSSLGFLLAKENLDVWLMNPRGNVFSRGHLTLDPNRDAEKYFDFSFHEHGIYDISAVIDYVLNNTGLTTLTYVGGSQGTTSFFVLCIERPEYQNKVDLFLANCPVTSLYYLDDIIIRTLAYLIDPIQTVAKALRIYDIFGPTTLMKKIQLAVCLNQPIGELFCYIVMQYIHGIDPVQFQLSSVKSVAHYFPAGGSLKEMVHYAQLIRRKEFRKYDYGRKKNLELYQQELPPIYNLSSVNLPVIIYYGNNDNLANYKNVMYVANKLPHLRKITKPKWPLFNHIDFLWAKDLYELLNQNVVQDVVTNI